MSDVRVCLSTIDNRENAEKLANQLVSRQLAACVNIVPGATSVYRWQDAVHQEQECVLIIKTTAQALPWLKDALSDLHPYDVPEFVVLDVSDGAMTYLDWVKLQVQPGAE